MTKSPLTLNDYSRIHFVGIGGIGVSGLARLCMHEGKGVSGSDRSASAITDALSAEGAKVIIGQAAENITDDIDLVVYTDAMSKDHPEMRAAFERGVPVLSYFEAVALVANEYYLIAVAGTHGKTTTTAMLIDIFEAADLDPTAIVGSLRARTKSNYRSGKSKYFIVEACEYRRHFLHFMPDVLVITNIEADHLDYYRDLADVQDAFRTLVGQVREGGFIICDHKDPSVALAIAGSDRTVIDYSQYIDVLMTMHVPGMHNRKNAAAARAAALAVGVDDAHARAALSNFSGTWRRFEYIGESAQGARIYDDYAHHPAEIAATIEGAKELYPDAQITVIFQPHLYTRTAELFDDFVKVLAGIDQVIITDIYAAREENEWDISGEKLAAAVHAKNTHARYVPFTEIVPALAASCGPNHVVITMGAGNIYEVARALVVDNGRV